MTTKEHCKQHYVTVRSQLGRKPLKAEYYLASKISKGALVKLYGSSAYSKLQAECGDEPNKLEMTRTSHDDIMTQYGDLVLELQAMPVGADWSHKGCYPTTTGLGKSPHNIIWSEMPALFRQWASSNSVEKYKEVLSLIPSTEPKRKLSNESSRLSKLLADIRAWSPARRRNTEGEYKIELRKQLETLGYKLNEEYGESNSDLVVEKTYIIETKKEPQLADYDRLFGQTARHLQQSPVVIVIIFDVPSEDKLDNFKILVDKHLNVDKCIVEVLKK